MVLGIFIGLGIAALGYGIYYLITNRNESISIDSF